MPKKITSLIKRQSMKATAINQKFNTQKTHKSRIHGTVSAH